LGRVSCAFGHRCFDSTSSRSMSLLGTSLPRAIFGGECSPRWGPICSVPAAARLLSNTSACFADARARLIERARVTPKQLPGPPRFRPDERNLSLPRNRINRGRQSQVQALLKFGWMHNSGPR